jgi:hypothetical protein
MAARATPERMDSGTFLVRMAPELHARCRAAARDAGLSLNAYCVRALAASVTGPAGADAEPVARALALFGRDLVAVLAFGSWARGEAGRDSDLDLLVVLEDRVELTRDLYRQWDATPLTWQDRRVDAHLVHPPAGASVSGLWAEVALDGLVLFERDRRLSVRLAAIRHEVAAGRLFRRVAHGQPYWTAVA